VDESIKEYLRRIGAKGGKAVAGKPQAKARAAKAAKARWAKRKQKKSEKS
jgi:ribosomal protein L12E/L44/L45/RPP1/RPP2